MKSLFPSSLIAILSVAMPFAPVRAQDQNPPAASAVDMKAARAEFQKALGEAKKDPAVAAAFKSANIMALNKLAQTNPNFADMAKQEIAKLEKPAGKPAAADGAKANKKDGDKGAPAAEGAKPASTEGKQKKNAMKKEGDTGAPAAEGTEKPASAEGKQKKNLPKKDAAPEVPANTSTNQ